MDLEHRIEKSILISDVCDIVSYHAVEHFSVFIKYVINQVYQEKNYRRILWVPILEIHLLHCGLSLSHVLVVRFVNMFSHLDNVVVNCC